MLLKLLIVWVMIAGQVNVNVMCTDEDIMPVDLCPYGNCGIARIENNQENKI